MKILVAGGAGFIGSHLCERLLNDSHQVICADNLITGSAANLSTFKNNPQFSFLNHDITKPIQNIDQVEMIFHLASPASPNHHSPISYFAYPEETMLANTQGTFELLKLAQKNKAKFLFASTSEVYGDPQSHPQKEDYNGNVSPTGPRSIYDEAKRFGETLTAFFERKYSLDTKIARIFNTYGPRMQKKDMRMIINFITQALEGKPITIYGTGKQTRSLIFIDDMIEGLVRLMFYQNTKGEIINLGSPDEHEVIEYALMVKKICNSSSAIIKSEKLPQDDPKKRKPDTSKAKKALNWQPTVSLEEGLKKTIEYFQHINNQRYE